MTQTDELATIPEVMLAIIKDGTLYRVALLVNGVSTGEPVSISRDMVDKSPVGFWLDRFGQQQTPD